MLDDHGITHARYSASAAHRWMRCYGSVRASDAVAVAPSSSYAADGTEAHALLAYALGERYTNAHEAFIMSGFEWTHRHDTQEERLDSVQECMDYVWGIINAYAPDIRLFLEVQFELPTSLDVDAGGTADVVIYIPSRLSVYVIDFKHGAGYFVSAEENEQLQTYGVGAVGELHKQGLRIENARLVICQPRAGGTREWDVDKAKLTAFLAKAEAAIIECEKPDAPLNPGDIQCQWCPAAYSCPARERQVVDRMFPNVMKADIVTASKTLPAVKAIVDVARIAQILDARDAIVSWLNEVDEYAMQLARGGTPIPGRKLVPVQARRRWRKELPDDAIAAELARVTSQPPETFLPPKIINITEAEKALKAAYKRSYPKDARAAGEAASRIMANLTLKDTSGNLTLVPLEDKREAVTKEDLFGHVTIEGTTNSTIGE